MSGERRQERRIADHDIDGADVPLEARRECVGNDETGIGQIGVTSCVVDRLRIEVEADQERMTTPCPHHPGGLHEETTVATGGIDDGDDTRDSLRNGLIDHMGDEVGRCVPGSEPSTSLALVHRKIMPATAAQTTPLAGTVHHSPSVRDVTMPTSGDASRYITFPRDEWAVLRAATPLTLRQSDLEGLQGINEHIDLDEVTTIYLPLTRLLNLYVAATQNLHKVSATFLGALAPKVPYVIGVAGSVAVGKSTFSRILQALLARWPDHPKVDLVTTDGFLYSNRVLEERGIMNRKGFPESYDTKRLLQFLREVKSGAREARAPVYSHVVYDIIEGEEVSVCQPDIVIIEGLNVLQVGTESNEFVSDYFDFSIYIDANEELIQKWYVERFLALRETVFQDPDSFFTFYAHLSADEATDVARSIWTEINGRNLRDNILPTRSRASLIIEKGDDHRVSEVHLRKL
jgi:type I pantothenate kinase